MRQLSVASAHLTANTLTIALLAMFAANAMSSDAASCVSTSSCSTSFRVKFND